MTTVTIQLDARIPPPVGPHRGFVEAQCMWCGARGQFRMVNRPGRTPYVACSAPGSLGRGDGRRICHAGCVWVFGIRAAIHAAEQPDVRITRWSE